MEKPLLFLIPSGGPSGEAKANPTLSNTMNEPWNSSIRVAQASDAEAIAGIYNEAVRTTTATFDTQEQSVGDRLRWLAGHDQRHPVVVAECDESVVAWGSLTPWSSRPAYRETVEVSFYVKHAYHGRGIGRAVLRWLIAEARTLDHHTMIARAADGSDASIHLCRSHGFELIGVMREVGLKFGRRLDVHILQLMLRDG